MSTEKITIDTINVPEVEKLLTETRAELVEAAKRDGKFAGLKNLPDPGDPSSAAHVMPFKTQVEERRSQALTMLQPDLHIEALRQIAAKHKALAEETAARIKELQHVNDVDRRELEGKAPRELQKSNVTGWTLTFLNALSDVAINSFAFEFLGDTLGFAIGIAIGVAVATFVLAKAITYCLRRAHEGARVWYAYAGGVALLAISGFWVLSEFRTGQMAATGQGSTASPLAFLLLNLFFFAAAVIIGLMFFPKDTQSEGDATIAERQALIKEREQEIATLKKKLDEAEAAAIKERKKHLSVLSYCVHTVNRFRSIYQEVVATWKSTNLLSRPDRSMPASFSEAVPELDPMQFDIPSFNLSAA